MKLALSSLLLGAASAFACGPFFPNTVLDHPSETLHSAPIASFARELEPLRIPTNLRAVDCETIDAAHDDLRAAELNSQPLAEFNDYQRGADLWHAGNTNAASSVWMTLLKRPAGERRYRSTWATFMLGKSYLATNPAKSIPWFHRTRELAGAGFYDTLGLAASSLGWEAQAELRQNHLDRATALYLQQLASGDSTAVASLRIVAEQVLKSDLNRSVRDNNIRRVVTAYIISHEQPPEAARAWLNAIEATGTIQLTGADRLAWAAYQIGDPALAARWLKCAPTDSPIAQWLRVKLLLRAGQLNEATAVLANIVRQFPQADDWPSARLRGEDWLEDEHTTPQPVAAELAVLQMSRGQFTDALDLLLRNDYWWDAAYVAERVLTADELKHYVDQRWSQSSWTVSRDGKFDPGGEIRWLLARRLARLGRFEEARPYYAWRFQQEFDKYVTALRTGHDAGKSAAERAAALWEAAQKTRWWGMTLLSTEGEPDCHDVDGFYEASLSISNRFASTNLVTAAERQRAAQPPAGINMRFHYRHLAANLAWDAAELMPDESTATARVLCEAGTWLKDRDPQAADRFYKALVKRCGTTELGKAADKKRWFPPISEPSDTRHNSLPAEEERQQPAKI